MITKEMLAECVLYVKNKGSFRKRNRGVPKFERHKMFDGTMLEIDTDDALLYMEENREKLFAEQLFSFIDRTGKTDSEIYKKALIDRRLFSKIRSNKTYVPSKKTVIALCLALELSRADADRLLFSAGYSLSRADDFELVIAFCIEKKIFDFFDINEILDHFGFDLF